MKASQARAGMLALMLTTTGGAAHAQEQTPFSQARTFDYRTQIPAVRPPATVEPGFTFAAAGDMIYALPMLPRGDAGVEAVAKVIRAADAASANQEGSIIDLEGFKGYLEAQNGGGYPVGKPELARDIAGLGFDFASKANNHSSDYGLAGLLESKQHLQDAGVRTPGFGLNRAQARAPQIMDTPRGRVAVIGAASTFVGSAPAGGAEGVAGGRPGISVVRTRRVVVLPEAEMAGVRAAASKLGQRSAADARQVTLAGQTFRTGSQAGYNYEIDDVDRFEILRAVRGAKNIADVAVFTIHAHENAGTGDDRVPADFQQTLYHDVIDAGGDIVAVHGPHLTRGVEIYKGKPIFYGLGHFAAHYIGSAPTTPEMAEASRIDPRFTGLGDADLKPSDASAYEGLLSVTEFGAGGAVKEIRLYPLDLRGGEIMKKRGYPRPATGAVAHKILAQVQKDSAPYGAQIAIEGDIGVIRPAN